MDGIKPILDLFCGEGGAAEGLQRAGFETIGIDIQDFSDIYPGKFIQADVLNFKINPDNYSAIWASPPCQAYSRGTCSFRLQGREYPHLIDITREKIKFLGLPYIIENVQGSPLESSLRLCGEMFNIKIIRHRLFESNFYIRQPKHIKHKGKVIYLKKQIEDNNYKYWGIYGHNIGSKEQWRKAMDIQNKKITKEGIKQAVPPVYSEYIAKYLIKYLEGN